MESIRKNAAWTLAMAIGLLAIPLVHAADTLPEIDSATDSGSLFEQGMVTLNFDANWESQDVVLPILKDAGIKSTFYVVTNDVTEGSGANLPVFKKIYDDGHEVSAHSRSHPSLTTLTNEQMDSEINGSREDLLAAGYPTLTYAYPYGDYNDAVKQMTEDAGFIGARGVEEGYNTKDTDRYALKVQNILNTTTPEEMESWVKTARENHTWLILVFHEVNAKNEPYGTTPEKFKTFVNYLKQNQVPTVTMEEGLNMMDENGGEDDGNDTTDNGNVLTKDDE